MKNITAIGEILFDIYPNEKAIGGAPFNFIYHIIKLTGSGSFISRIGNDEQGKEVQSFLSLKNISQDFVQIDNEHPTGAARPVLDEKKVPEWKIEEGSAYDFIERTSENEKLVKNSGCLYYGTLAQRGEASRKTIQSFFGKDLIFFCDLNIRQNFYSEDIIKKSIEAADVLKLNEDELMLVNDLFLKKDYQLKKTASSLKNKFDIKLLCITKGDEGAYLFKDNEIEHYKKEAEEITDTVGAGDAYSALLCTGYLKNWNLRKINKAASQFALEIIKIKGAIPMEDNLYNSYREAINE